MDLFGRERAFQFPAHDEEEAKPLAEAFRALGCSVSIDRLILTLRCSDLSSTEMLASDVPTIR